MYRLVQKEHDRNSSDTTRLVIKCSILYAIIQCLLSDGISSLCVVLDVAM
jgi:hypothetical protein